MKEPASDDATRDASLERKSLVDILEVAPVGIGTLIGDEDVSGDGDQVAPMGGGKTFVPC